MAQKRLNKRQQRLERQRRIKKKRRKRLAIIMIEIIILAGLGVVAYGMFVMDKMETTTLNKDKLEVYKDTGDYTNIALFGLDSRDGEMEGGVQSDCIMVASINNKTNEINLISVYRDTLMKVTSEKYGKANSAYNIGGPTEAIALLNRNLDLDIEKYISVNFNALSDVIDTLGGLEIELTDEEAVHMNNYCVETSKVTGKSYEPVEGGGLKQLNGVQATSYCRIRYTKGDDFRRTERQRLVIQKVVEKLQSSNLATINKIADDVFEEVGTNFTLPEILSYAKDFKKYKLGETTGFPFNVTTGTLSGIGSSIIPTSYVNDVQQLHQFFFGDDGYTPSETVQNIGAGIQKKSTDIGKSTTKDEDSYYDDDSSGSSSKNSKKSSSGSSNSGTSSGGSGSGSSGSGSGGSKSDSGSGGGSGSSSSGNSGSGGGSESGGSGSGGSSSGGGSESGGSSSGGGESSGGESAE